VKVIIAGSRTVTDFAHVHAAIVSAPFYWEITEVVSGTCRGVDALGEQWAEGLGVRVKRFPADWSKGKQAGPVRNRQMAEYADALIAVWDGHSRGTADMIAAMKALGKPVHVHATEED
jgi:hypothetical protein